MVNERVPIFRVIIAFFLLTTKVNHAQQSDENKNFKLFVTNGFQNQQTLPSTGPVLISSNSKSTVPTLDPQQLNVKQQINSKQQITPEALKSQQKLPVGIVNLVNGKLSQISPSDPYLSSTSYSKGGQNNMISTSIPISMADLSNLQPLFGNQPIVLTEVIGDKNQPSSVTLHVIPTSHLQSNAGSLYFPQNAAQSGHTQTFSNRVSPATAKIIANDASLGGNLQNNLLTNQQLLPQFQIISSGDSQNRMEFIDTHNPKSLDLNDPNQPSFGINYGSQAPLYGFSNQPLTPESHFVPQYYNNPYVTLAPQFMLSPAYPDSQYNAQRSNKKSKSSLKALLPLLLGILREKYTCCPNCKCGNCTKNIGNLSDVTQILSNKLIEAPNFQENTVDNEKGEDIENEIKSETKQIKKKYGKYKKSIESDEDYVDSLEDED